MKIILYGEGDRESSGAWCYAETLRELGHTVVTVSSVARLLRYQRTLLGRVHGRLFGSAFEPVRRWHVALLRAEVRRLQPDMCIVLKGVNVSSDDVRALKRDSGFVVNINHDDFFSRYHTNWSRLQRAATAEYDYVLTTREVNVAELRPYTRRVEFFPFAYYPRIHRPVPIPEAEREQWNNDVAFVGSWEQERARLFEYLVQRVPARYAIWGSGWEHVSPHSPLAAFVRGREAVLDDMAKALGGARIALGFLRRANRDDYTQRTFEIPACNGLLLAERTARHQSFFREGEEAEFFSPDDPDELVAKVRALLAEPERREAMRNAGRAALLRQRHTYADRMQRLFELYRAHARSIPQRSNAPIDAE